MTGDPRWSASIADDALRRLALHVARTTPGVVRLQPAFARRVVGSARRATSWRTVDADLDAVTLVRTAGGGVDVEIRVAVTLDDGPATVARALAAALRSTLGAAADAPVAATVVIADVVA